MTENVWFTSDTHFFHKNIMHIGKGRPWPDSDTMTDALVERWNKDVRKGDRIYHLGDFSFGNKAQTDDVLARLHGQIHLIRGNHDGGLDRFADRFVSYQAYKEIKIGCHRLVLFHFPIHSWHNVHHGSLHLHGHCHGGLPDNGSTRMDVGVDTHDYRPWHVDEILERLVPRIGAWLPGDYHTAEVD